MNMEKKTVKYKLRWREYGMLKKKTVHAEN